MRIVLDTNVIISAFFWNGPPRMVYNLVRNGSLTMVFSQELENEFIRVLLYPQFGLSNAELIPFLRDLRTYAEYAEVSDHIAVITADPTDNMVLECAVGGSADYIISGDRHLLDVSSFRGIPIMKSKEFLLKEGFLKL